MSTNHADVVAGVKADLQRQGVDLRGANGAFEITKRVAWALRGEGAGLLYKPSGNNAHGYAVGEICYSDGSLFDILRDDGGANDPQWNPDGRVDPVRYRAPFDPSTTHDAEPGPVPSNGAGTPAPEPDDAIVNQNYGAKGEYVRSVVLARLPHGGGFTEGVRARVAAACARLTRFSDENVPNAAGPRPRDGNGQANNTWERNNIKLRLDEL
jgi:hypothetical protein